jgi:hypothetical protein
MTFNWKSMVTGILAGVTAALLVLGALNHATLSFTLYAISTLPILIAGLGWGNAAAAIAVVAAGLTIAGAVAPKAALFVTIVSFLPAGWISHLANLARPAAELGGPKDMLAWYPLPNILLHLCGLVAGAALVTGYMIGYGPELVDSLVNIMVSAAAQDPAAPPMDPAAVAQTKRLLLHILPAMQGMIWVFTQFVTYYLATRLVAASGRRVRPRENIASSLRMNRNAIFVFLAAMVLAFFNGPIGFAGAAVAGAFGAGFIMAGFAVLHFRTLGKSYRLPLLILAYLGCLVLVFPALVILVLGLSDTRQAIPLTSAPGAGAP